MVEVRPMSLADIPEVIAVQRLAFPEPFDPNLLWKEAHLRTHIERFPAGQLVAIVDDQLVGCASNCLIERDRWENHGNWNEAVGGVTFEYHTDQGSVLYGADISVHTRFRKVGVGRALYQARFNLCQAHRWTYATACRLPDYHRYVPHYPAIEDYVEAVQRGRIVDRTLTPMLKFGLSIMGIAPEYMEDVESCNFACVLEKLQ